MKPLLTPYLQKKRLSIVKSYLKGAILDIGCGDASLVRFLDKGQTYVGIESDGEVVEELRTRYPKYYFYQRDIETDELPLFEEQFDVIVMAAVIEHLQRPEIVLKACCALLRDKGNLVITTPTPFGGKVHKVRAKLGLTCKSAVEEHYKIYSVNDVEVLLRPLRFRIDLCRKFGFGMNQLFICKKDTGVKEEIPGEKE